MGHKKNIEIDEKIDKNRSKVLNVLEPGFAAPDGGWGWVIVAASGFMNVFCLSLLICFGLIFRDHFHDLGINASQTTTILNINSAVASVVGLTNGPLFRKYTYRRAACVGGMVTVISICALSFTKTFYGFIIFFSILYACGKSVAMSASSLALMTYFKKKRRIAVGLSWACSGIGSIVLPQLATKLTMAYGMAGTVLIFGGLALNSVVCAVMLQPVEMHAKRITKCGSFETATKDHDEHPSPAMINGSGKIPLIKKSKQRNNLPIAIEKRSSQLFGSQCLYYSDDENGPAGLDVVAMGMSMMSRANDGWFSKLNASRASLTSSKSMQNECSAPDSINFNGKLSPNPPNRYYSDKNLNRPNCEINGKKRETNGTSPTKHFAKTNPSEFTDNDENLKNNGRTSPNNNDDNTECLLQKVPTITHQESEELEPTKPRWCSQAFHNVAIFFDLDLLRDCVYVNLMIGVSFAIFTEINSILLTPYILLDYGLSDKEVATVISVLAGIDVFTRAAVSFIATRIGWSNRTFLLIGIGISSFGRIGMAHLSIHYVIIFVPIFNGIGKALTLVFSNLVIPSHVPLEKLPGATGLQLVTKGMMFLALGPIVGWIRDTSGDYTFTLHFLNVFSYLVIISWIIEGRCCSSKRKRLDPAKGTLV